jgi:hypothetical protein
MGRKCKKIREGKDEPECRTGCFTCAQSGELDPLTLGPVASLDVECSGDSLLTDVVDAVYGADEEAFPWDVNAGAETCGASGVGGKSRIPVGSQCRAPREAVIAEIRRQCLGRVRCAPSFADMTVGGCTS